MRGAAMSGKAKSLADQAYETIKQNILNLTYPPGMPLTEAKLAEELGMSRSQRHARRIRQVQYILFDRLICLIGK